MEIKNPLSGKFTVFGLSRFQCLLLTEFLLLSSMGLFITSVFLPSWRVGGSSSYMYPPAMNQGFSHRNYGLIYVEGLRRMSWAELATSTCDRWGMYIHTKPLFPFAAVCNSALADKAKCTKLFENHLYNRCNAYSTMTLISWITTGLLSVSTLLVAITSIVMLLIPLGTWKRFVVAALASASVVAVPILISWMITSMIAFDSLTSTAAYPSARLGLGFWLAMGGGIALVLATLVFWRLSQGLKLLPSNNDKISTSNAGLLDLAEHKLLSGEKIDDDTDDDEQKP
jgi:hypothetical protein